MALYTKAIEVCPAEDVPAKAILHANRSMCRLSMNATEGAVEDAQSAIQLDPTYIKGYYRLGMAYTQAANLTKAKEAFLQGLDKKPDDKELRAQVEAVEKKLKEKAASVSASSSSSSRSTTTTTAATTVKSPPAAKSSSAAPASSASAAAAGQGNDDDDDLGNLNMRGYRVRADGKMTTFFNHDLDETTKQLIGDIAPKKLVEETAAPIHNGEGSAWNAAGTYEERILTPWALNALKAKLSAIASVYALNDLSPATAAKLPPGAATLLLEVTEVKDVTGDAQVTLARGKKKHLCDMSAVLVWKLSLNCASTEGANGAAFSIEGETKVFDITADDEHELEDAVVTQFNGAKADKRGLSPAASAAFQELVLSGGKGLKTLIPRALADFCQELKQK